MNNKPELRSGVLPLENLAIMIVPAEGRLSERPVAYAEIAMSLTIITTIITLKITAGLGKTAQDRVVESGFRAAD